jgi:hypothetical protein
MLPQSAPNWWSCLPTAFAIVLDMPVRDLIFAIGHDGSQIVFPQFEEPYCRRAFHVQELIDPCMECGFALVIVEAVPILSGPDFTSLQDVQLKGGNGVRLARYMHSYKGVLCGEREGHKAHAVGWDRESYYETNGTVTKVMEFNVREFLALIPIDFAQSKLVEKWA